MSKVFITRPIPAPAESILKNAGHEVEVGKKLYGLPKKKLIDILRKGNYDAMLSFLTDDVDESVVDAFSESGKGKVIANYAVGSDNINISYARSKNILVTNTPPGTESVSEFAAALILAVSKRVVEADAFTKDGKYKCWDPNLLLGHVIKGKTLGIIGTGRIGGKVAHMMNKGFGVNVIYHDIFRNEKIENDCGAKFIENMDDVFRRSDILSLHTPLTNETRHLASRERLSLMKKESIFINTSRGPVVDENALTEMLEKMEIKGAGLDVFEYEPKIAKKLRRLPNVVLTPHIASGTMEERENMSRTAAENIIEALSEKEPKDLVN